MDLDYMLKNGLLSLNNLSQLIDKNQVKANKLRLRLSWFFDKGDFVGRIYERDKVIFEKKYEYKYTHVNIAHMHYDWQTELDRLIFLRTPHQPVTHGKGQKGSGDRNWAETVQKNKEEEYKQLHPDTDYADNAPVE